MHKKTRFCSMAFAAALSVAVQAAGEWPQPTAWSGAIAVAEVHSPAADGYPIEVPNGLSLSIASTRRGTPGGNGIWAGDRLDREAA